MRTGPKPKPRALANTQATTSQLPADVLKACPKPPAWCTGPDADLWRSTCRILIKRQHLTTGDLLAVEGLVIAWSNVRAARESQDLTKSNRFLITAKTYLRELGLSPGSRDRVPATPGMLQEPADLPGDDLAAFKVGTIPMTRTGAAS